MKCNFIEWKMSTLVLCVYAALPIPRQVETFAVIGDPLTRPKTCMCELLLPFDI